MGFQVVVANIWGCELAPICCDNREKFPAFPPLLEVLAIETSDLAIATSTEFCTDSVFLAGGAPDFPSSLL